MQSPAQKCRIWRLPALPYSTIAVQENRIRTKFALKKRFKDVIESNPSTGATAPPTVYQLLKTCGTDLVYENPSARISIANEMWKTLKQKGMTNDVGLYNTLLQTYLLNDHSFVPSDFLKEMKSNNVSPNQGTLSLILQAYCHQGNVAGATGMLERIKSLDLPINEHVYASLVTGHARSGDMGGALQVMEMMKGNGLEPGVVTYTALLLAYAEKGDIEAIEKVLSEMRTKRVFAPITLQVKIMDTLSLFNHGKHVLKMLSMIHNKQWIVSDLRNLVFQFAARGEVATALDLLQYLTSERISINVEREVSLGVILLRSMLEQGGEVEGALERLKHLEALEPREQLMQCLLYEVYQREQLDRDCKKVLKHMKVSGYEIRNCYVYPLLAYHATKKDLKGLVEDIKFMTELQLVPDDVVGRLCYSAVSDCDQSKLDELSKVMSSEEGLRSSVLRVLCYARQLQYVGELISTNGCSDLDVVLRSVEQEASSRFVKVPTLVGVYKSMAKLSPVPVLEASVNTVVGRLLSESPQKAVEFIELVGDLGFCSSKFYSNLLATFNKQNMAKGQAIIMQIMKDKKIPFTEEHHEQVLRMANMSRYFEGTRAAYTELLKTKPSLAYSLYICALLKNGKYASALKMYSEMRKKSLNVSPEESVMLMSALLKAGEIDAAESMKAELQDQSILADPRLNAAFLEAYACRGDVPKAQLYFGALQSTPGVTPSPTAYANLMSSYSFHGDHTVIRQLLQEVQSQGLPIKRAMITHLLEAHIISGDLEGALVVMNEYTSTPPLLYGMVKLLEAAIAMGKKDNMDAILSSMQMVGASPEKLATIQVVAYFKAGNIEKARSLLKEHPIPLNEKNLMKFVQLSLASGKHDLVREALSCLRENASTAKSHRALLVESYKLLGDTVEAEKVRQELRIKKNTPPSSTVVTGDHSATQKDTPPSSAVVTDATADGGTAV